MNQNNQNSNWKKNIGIQKHTEKFRKQFLFTYMLIFLNNMLIFFLLYFFQVSLLEFYEYIDINQVIKVQVINFCDLPDECILRVILWHPCRIFQHGEVNKYVHSSYQIHTPKLPVRTSLPGPSVQKNISNTIPNVKPSEQDQCIAWSLEYPHFRILI